MQKETQIAIALGLLCIPIFAVPVGLGWIKNLTDLVTQIVAGAILILAGTACAFWYKSWSKEKKEGTVKVQLPTAQVIHKDYPPSKTDPTYEHLQAHLFWESWRYNPIAKRLGAKNGRKHLCGTKLIVNLHTKKAYQVSSYLGSLILSGKIQYHDRRKTFPNSELGKWAEQKGYTFYDRFPTEEELQPVIRKANEEADSGKEKDKPESSGSVVHISLGEFTLITDKLAYKVGDTIHATVKVLSLGLGTTTVRLISPSKEQISFKTATSHFSTTSTFDLEVVRASWEKGTYRVIAQRGETSAEQKIEIL